MLNFTWWVNRKDAPGRNVFTGGFLGPGNSGVFDRSGPLPTGYFTNKMPMHSLGHQVGPVIPVKTRVRRCST